MAVQFPCLIWDFVFEDFRVSLAHNRDCSRMMEKDLSLAGRRAHFGGLLLLVLSGI